jgi:hypothetical protein
MCDGGRVGANQRRASDSRSRLTAWLATGVPCAQPGRDVDRKRKTLFSGLLGKICAGGGASRRRTGGCAGLSWVGEGEGERLEGRARGGKGRRGEEDRRGEDTTTADRTTAEGRTAAEQQQNSSRGSRRTLGLCSADSSPSSPSSPFASAGGVCLVCRGATTLRPTYAPNLPTFGPTLLVSN